MRNRLARSLTTLISCIGLASACAHPGGGGPETAAGTGATDPLWLATAQRHIAAREYWASENGDGLQAPNRAHDLRTYFEKTGIRVHDRTAGGSPELLRLSLSGVGREKTLAAPAAGALVTDENRVEIHRPGLVEWYVNSPAGLEQGFTLEERPAGEGPLVAELRIASARLALRGSAVSIDTGTRRLRFGELAAVDAEGRSLAAHFELPETERLRIVVEDAGATYPIVIDPLLTETADTQLESDQGSAQFGRLGSAGDVNGDGYADVIVGAPLYDAGLADEGAAFVFLGSATGIADGGVAGAAAQLESDQAGAQMGRAVAGAGDVNGDGYGDVIVSAVNYDAGQGVGEGAAFVFLGSATGIADGNPSTAAAQLESDQANARLGFSVAGAGDVNGDGYADVIVGANLYDAGQTDEGAAFVFHGSATGIADGNPATAVTQLESNQAIGTVPQFGGSVAGAGDVNGDGYADVIVGASFYDAGSADEGAAFVFHGSATGIADGNPATAVTQLESNQAIGTVPQFGGSVAGAGDVNGDGYADVIVGALSYDATLPDSGAAFVFHGSATGIANGNPTTAETQLESVQGSAQFGRSVSGAGDVNGDGYADVIVSAPLYDAGSTDEGAAFVFHGSATGIADGNPATAAAQLESNQASAAADFSAGVGDVNGDGYADVMMSASSYDAPSADEGAAFLYLGGAAGIADGSPATAAAQLESNQANVPPAAFGSFGYSVSGAGDVNRDGYSDVVVGAPYYDAGLPDEGAAFVFHGSAAGIASGNPTTANALLESNQNAAQFGYSVSGAGDVNGDGYADLIVGAPVYDNPDADEGAAFVFHGSAAGIASGNPTTAAATFESNQLIGSSLLPPVFGYSVAGAGDVNGDGYGDVIVGAAGYDNAQDDEGAAFVFLGSASGIASGNPATAAAQIEPDQPTALLGYSVASAGDVNGDGYADVIVSAPNYDAGTTDEGAAFVFLGSASGIADGSPTTASAQLESDLESAFFGGTVDGAGDVNGDGYADVIVGSLSAYVFLGSASGIPDGNPITAETQLDSAQEFAAFINVASAGDVNGDGYADVIVGAHQYDNPNTNPNADEGAAFVFLGSASGIAGGNPSTSAAQLESNQAGAHLGISVAGAGDVNGDGFADVIIGADSYDAGETNEGAAFVFLGNSATGRPVLARQRRGNGSGIAVQPWGGAHSGTGFAAELRASHPYGTGRVKAELEACPDGPPAVAFGHASCTTALTPTWIAVNGTTPDVLISHTFSGLTPNTLYRWRARVLHAASTGAIATEPAHGPWRRVAGQSVEADIRLPEPGLALALANGAALLAALARRRARGLRN